MLSKYKQQFTVKQTKKIQRWRNTKKVYCSVQEKANTIIPRKNFNSVTAAFSPDDIQEVNDNFSLKEKGGNLRAL